MKLIEVLELRKSKYVKRWKGKDGKYHYTYKKLKGKPEMRAGDYIDKKTGKVYTGQMAIDKRNESKESKKQKVKELESKLDSTFKQSDIQWVKDNYKKFKSKLSPEQRKKVESAMKQGKWKEAKKILVPKAWGLDRMRAKIKAKSKPEKTKG